jgi:hypothetical protein
MSTVVGGEEGSVARPSEFLEAAAEDIGISGCICVLFVLTG